MTSKQILLPFVAVALVTVAGCAVSYDDRYGYNGGYGYDNGGYGHDTYAAVPPAVNVPPDLVVLPGTDIYAAPSAGTDLYFVDGYWWRPWNGHWYRSHQYGGDWAMVSSTPYFYRSIPHGWREDYYHNRWNGRPWSYHHVARDEAVANWNTWKREGYWRDQRWAASRDRYRRDSASTEDRYDQRRDYRNYDQSREHERTYNNNDRRETSAPSGGYRYNYNDRREVPREASSPRGRYGAPREASSPAGRYDSRTGHTQPANRVEHERREVRPTTRGQVEERRIEERRVEPSRTGPAVRSTNQSAPAGTVRRTDERAPVVRSESPHHRATPSERDRRTAPAHDRNSNPDRSDRTPF
jgi:hypothetical protein